MKREYWLVLIVYCLMQFSSLIGVPLFEVMGANKGLSYSVWLVVKFLAALTIVGYILRKEFKYIDFSKPGILKWAVFGGILALFFQYAAAWIQTIFGVRLDSENTQNITNIIKTFPLAIIVSNLAAPILEEIVFRKIIFGAFNKQFNFVLAALISSLIFAISHLDLDHILQYTVIGFTFAFIYSKRKSILSPIMAHIIMNSFVLIVGEIH